MPVTVVTLATVEDVLRAEEDENTCRKALTVTEGVAASARRERLLGTRPKHLGGRGLRADTSGNFPEVSADARRTRTLAALGTGYSHKTLEKAAEVLTIAQAAGEQAEMRGRVVTITPAVREVAVAAAEALAQPGAKVDAAHRRDPRLDTHAGQSIR